MICLKGIMICWVSGCVFLQGAMLSLLLVWRALGSWQIGWIWTLAFYLLQWSAQDIMLCKLHEFSHSSIDWLSTHPWLTAIWRYFAVVLELTDRRHWLFLIYILPVISGLVRHVFWKLLYEGTGLFWNDVASATSSTCSGFHTCCWTYLPVLMLLSWRVWLKPVHSLTLSLYQHWDNQIYDMHLHPPAQCFNIILRVQQLLLCSFCFVFHCSLQSNRQGSLWLNRLSRCASWCPAL